MDTIAPTVDLAMTQITSLDDLRTIAAQREVVNAVYGPAAAKLRAAGHSVQAIADAYGIHRTTAHVLIRDAA
jgi:hypothetical protein